MARSAQQHYAVNPPPQHINFDEDWSTGPGDDFGLGNKYQYSTPLMRTRQSVQWGHAYLQPVLPPLCETRDVDLKVRHRHRCMRAYNYYPNKYQWKQPISLHKKKETLTLNSKSAT